MKDESVLAWIEPFNQRSLAFILPPSAFILAFLRSGKQYSIKYDVWPSTFNLELIKAACLTAQV